MSTKKDNQNFALRCPYCNQWGKYNFHPEEYALKSMGELKQILNDLDDATTRGRWEHFQHKKLFRCPSSRWDCPQSSEVFICKTKNDTVEFLKELVYWCWSPPRAFRLYKGDRKSRWIAPEEQYFGIIFNALPVSRQKDVELENIINTHMLSRLILGIGVEIEGPLTVYTANVFFPPEEANPKICWMPVEGYSKGKVLVPPHYNEFCKLCRGIVMNKLVKEVQTKNFSVNNCPIGFGKNKMCAGRKAACIEEDWNHCPAFIKEREGFCPCYSSDKAAIKELKKKWLQKRLQQRKWLQKRLQPQIPIIYQYQCKALFREVAFSIEVHNHLVGIAMSGQVFYNKDEIADTSNFVDEWGLLKDNKNDLKQAIKKELKPKKEDEPKFFIAKSAFNRRIVKLKENCRQISEQADALYRDFRLRLEAAFREEIIGYVRSHGGSPSEYVPHVAKRMREFWAFEAVYIIRYSPTSNDISLISCSYKNEKPAYFGPFGKFIEKKDIQYTDTHPAPYLYRVGQPPPKENPLLSLLLKSCQDAFSSRSDIQFPLEGKCYFSIAFPFFDEVLVFLFAVRDEEVVSNLPSLDPGSVSQLCQDAILDTCNELAYEFRADRVVRTNLEELRFVTDLIHRAHTSDAHLSTATDRLKEALEEIEKDKSFEIIRNKIHQALDNSHAAYDSIHAMYILSRYMRKKDVKGHLVQEKFGLNDLLNDLSNDETLKSRANMYVKSFGFTPYKDEDIILEGDRAIIYELLYCIIDNAIVNGSAKMPGSNVSVTVRTDIKESTNGTLAVVEVSDDGCGLEQEDLDSINKLLSEDLVLGYPLSIGYGILMAKCAIDIHSGLIKFMSQKGKGTTVKITLGPIYKES
jgi:hypothetical protein